MAVSFCPGSAGIKGPPTLKIKHCPECGADVEVFSNLNETHCTKCGFKVYNDTMTCILWCKYAKDCVGEDVYEQFRSAFSAAAESGKQGECPEGKEWPLEKAE